MKQNRSLVLAMTVFVLLTAGAAIFSQTKNDIMLNRRGVELGEANRLDEAIKEFDKVIEARDHAAARAYHNKGYALEKKGELADAIKHYEEAWKRNPGQIVTGQRLGFGYYTTGDYERAVDVGEAVLKLDPEDKEVPRWLSDAYKKRMEKRQEELLAEEQRKLDEERRKAEELDRKKLEMKKERDKSQFFEMAIDAMLRTGLYYGKRQRSNGLYYTTNRKFRVITEKGLIVDIPETIYMKFTPIPLISIELMAEKPWLGGGMPNFIEQSEKLELTFNFKRFVIGTGAWFNHYDGDAAFYRRYKLFDAKVGFIVGYKKKKVEARFTWYPRMLIMDPRSSTGKTLDTGSFRIDYAYQMKSFIKIYALIYARDYYVFCHSFDWRVFYASYYHYSRHIASYWGVYDLGLGINLSDLIYRADDTKFSVSIEWLQRFYLRDLENINPYTLAPNGQGWFGLNLKKFTKGAPFSGFHAISQVIGLRFDEQITKHFFMYQKAILELGDQNAQRHEFNLQIGMGVKI